MTSWEPLLSLHPFTASPNAVKKKRGREEFLLCFLCSDMQTEAAQGNSAQQRLM